VRGEVNKPEKGKVMKKDYTTTVHKTNTINNTNKIGEFKRKKLLEAKKNLQERTFTNKLSVTKSVFPKTATPKSPSISFTIGPENPKPPLSYWQTHLRTSYKKVEISKKISSTLPATSSTTTSISRIKPPSVIPPHTPRQQTKINSRLSNTKIVPPSPPPSKTNSVATKSKISKPSLSETLNNPHWAEISLHSSSNSGSHSLLSPSALRSSLHGNETTFSNSVSSSLKIVEDLQTQMKYFESEVRKYRRECEILAGENSVLSSENQKLKSELKSQSEVISDEISKRIAAEKSLESLKAAVHSHFVSLKEL